MEMAPAMVAVMVIVSVSRFFTWESSWASTPGELFAVDSARRMPLVTHTAACSGLRPVAKALGWGLSAI